MSCYSVVILTSGNIGFSKSCIVLTKLWLVTLPPSLIARQLIGHQTEGCLFPKSVSEGWHLTITVCGWAYEGLPCDFLLFLSGFRLHLTPLLYFPQVLKQVIQYVYCFMYVLLFWPVTHYYHSWFYVGMHWFSHLDKITRPRSESTVFYEADFFSITSSHLC